jgi:hypothetical protein
MDLREERSTNIMQIVSDLKKMDSIEELVDVRGMSDGFTVFVRGVDGNAYELQIRPASLAQGHEEVRGANKYAERKKKRKDEIRKNFGMD